MNNVIYIISFSILNSVHLKDYFNIDNKEQLQTNIIIKLCDVDKKTEINFDPKENMQIIILYCKSYIKSTLLLSKISKIHNYISCIKLPNVKFNNLKIKNNYLPNNIHNITINSCFINYLPSSLKKIRIQNYRKFKNLPNKTKCINLEYYDKIIIKKDFFKNNFLKIPLSVNKIIINNIIHRINKNLKC